ncbi:MAG: ABC transporter permease [Betaproteobacteria bacterium]
MALVLVFLLLPIAIVVAVSFTPSAIFDLPTGGLSLRWYAKLWEMEDFWKSFGISFYVAGISTAISIVLGISCSIAVVRGRFFGRNAIATFLISPLMLPGLVFGIALLQGLRAIGIGNALVSLMIAHVVITLPFVARSVMASLSLFDFTLIHAARTLGLSPARAIWRVMIPNIAPGVLTGALFAFIASFDNYAISLFLTDVHTKTLPIQMLSYLEEAPDPSVAAISTVLIVMTIAMLIICDRLVGLGRIANV